MEQRNNRNRHMQVLRESCVSCYTRSTYTQGHKWDEQGGGRKNKKGRITFQRKEETEITNWIQDAGRGHEQRRKKSKDNIKCVLSFISFEPFRYLNYLQLWMNVFLFSFSIPSSVTLVIYRRLTLPNSDNVVISLYLHVSQGKKTIIHCHQQKWERTGHRRVSIHLSRFLPVWLVSCSSSHQQMQWQRRMQWKGQIKRREIFYPTDHH